MTARIGKAAGEDKRRSLARKFFAPSVFLMNRLKYLKKFILISACFAVPIAVSMYLLIDRNIDYWEGFTRKEVEGVRYISRIRKLIEDVQTHRALAMILAAGDASAADRLLPKEAGIDEGLNGLSGFAEKMDEQERNRWDGINGAWQRLKERERTLTADELFAEHNSLIASLRAFMEITSYSSNLILDPDSASYFLINLIVRDLPRLTERIERLNALGSYALARRRLGADEKERLMLAAGEIRASMDTLKADLDVLTAQRELRADAASPGVSADIRMIIAKSEDYLKLVDASIIRAGKPQMPHWEFFDTSTDFFRPIYETYNTSGAELADIFSARTRRLAGQSMIAWGASAIIVSLVLYLLAGFYISVIETVSNLGVATRQMSLTGLPETISLESRDELSEVVAFFNEVALALRRSHEVLLHSERLARIGSWDLDRAAGTMQWSPEMYRIYELDPADLPRPGLEVLFLKVHPDDVRMVRENIEKGIDAGSIPLFEYRLALKDGSVRHLSFEGEARPYGTGMAVSMTGFVQDITDRKKAEEELREALRKVKQLSGLLPICASCKKIRDDKGYWESIERYIERHSEAEFSHSLCDDCAKRLYPNFHGKRTDTG